MQNHPRPETPAPLSGAANLASDSDRHLLARTRLSDIPAFEQLFRRYYHPLHRLLFRMLGDVDQAEDVVQETFVALYTHPPHLVSDSDELRTWLYRVALNRGYNVLRSRRRAEQHLPDLFATAQPPDPESEALRAEERERVRIALSRLPERQAKLLVLRQDEGLRYAEIASILEVAPGSIGTLLVRAQRAFALAWTQLDAAPSPPPSPSLPSSPPPSRP
jgi:RNA polymerase sigma-70 factor, ECF subfamily